MGNDSINLKVISKMPRLMKAQLWALMFYTKCSKPCNKTLKAWVNTGFISGQLMGPKEELHIYEDQLPYSNSHTKATALAIAMNLAGWE